MEVGRFFSCVAPIVVTLILAPKISAAVPPKGESVDAEVQFKMGIGYFRAGEPAEAVRWLERAAKSNHTRAQGMLGLCHYAGRGVSLDFDKAAYWLARAAAKEDAIAQFSLARLYVNGRGVPHNLAKASELYLLAANQGHAAAQVHLGAIQERGSGVPRDLKSATKWYAKAAQQGLAVAQLNLGRMHSTGRGVKQDHVLAAKWYEAAAEQGLGHAQFLLGASLYLGEGVPQDFVKAYKWMNLAAAQGIEAAQEHRQTITDKLTPRQLAVYFKLVDHLLEEAFPKQGFPPEYIWSTNRLRDSHHTYNIYTKPFKQGVLFSWTRANNGNSYSFFYDDFSPPVAGWYEMTFDAA